MKEKELFTHPNITIKEQADGILYVQVSGFINIDVMKIYDKQLVLAVRTTGIKKILTDTQNMRVMSREAKQYNEDVFIKNFQRIGIKHNAILVSGDVYGKMSAESVVKKRQEDANYKLNFKVFDEPTKAFEWLREQK